MKLKFFCLLISFALLGSSRVAVGQPLDTNLDRYNALITKINAEVKAGKHTEIELADDLSQFDALLAAEKGARTQLASHILWQKGVLYLMLLGDPDKAKACFRELKTNYSGMVPADQLDAVLDDLEVQLLAKKARDALPPGSAFVDFKMTDVAGQSLSVSKYKGRVVLVDFWATWCPSCLMEMPNVIATYDKYHAQGFEIIGVSLDDDKNRLLSFTQEKKMPWPEYFDGLHWKNKLSTKYGIMAIPASILIDAQGKVIAWDLRGDELAKAVAKALAR